VRRLRPAFVPTPVEALLEIDFAVNGAEQEPETDLNFRKWEFNADAAKE
jgi:hypothetical protein